MLPTLSLLRRYEAFPLDNMKHAHVWCKLADQINREYDTLIKYRAFPLIELVQASEPYKDLHEMRNDYLQRHLKVSELHCEHPVFDKKTNIRFRILHDIAHCVTHEDFSAQGEYNVFVHQSHGLPQELQHALYTEIVIQASYKIHRGHFPVQKLFINRGYL